MTAQLGFFDDEKAAASAETRTARLEWRARFEYTEFCPLPYMGLDYAHRGPVCPACGRPEWNDGALWVHHGYDPDRPGVPYGGEFGATCTRLGRAA